MNCREVSIVAATVVVPGVLLLGLLCIGGHSAPAVPPTPVIVHQLPAGPVSPGPIVGVDA